MAGGPGPDEVNPAEGAPGPSHLGTGEGRIIFPRRRIHSWSTFALYERRAHPVSADGGVSLPYLQLLPSPPLPVVHRGNGAF